MSYPSPGGRNINSVSNLEILHSNQLWLLMSNYTLQPTTALTENLHISSLSKDAEALIDEVYWSDTPRPLCGWRALAQIQQILRRELLAKGPLRQGRRREYLLRLVIEYADGNQGKIYKFTSAEDTEGYSCELARDFPAQRLLSIVSLSSLNIELARVRLKDSLVELSGSEAEALISAISKYSQGISTPSLWPSAG